MVRKMGIAALLCVFACAGALAADFNGKWSAEFDTQIGVQKYTYEFHVDGTKLTGKAVSERGSTDIQEGTIAGDTISFVEVINFQGNDLRISYTGKMEVDQIKFTRKVADFATEELTAKRVK